MYKLTKTNNRSFENGSMNPIGEYFDKMFSDAFSNFPTWFMSEMTYNTPINTVFPPTNVEEFDDRVEYTLSLNGYSKENISVTLNDNTFTVRGTSTNKNNQSNSKFITREIKKSSFSRDFQLYRGLDKSTLRAKFEDGFLIITVDKVKNADLSEPKNIEIL